MAERFERTLPPAPLPWTGERMTTLSGAQVELEHLHRYFLARSLVAGLDVLDIASGEGYGSALLAQTARSVIGVDLDPASVRHAQAAYATPILRFMEGDARRIPLPPASVDAVVSFETIEHFAEHEDFLAEISRVLRPGGRFIVSSPERDAYAAPGKPPNPFHARELTRDEFVSALQARFAHVSLLGQRNVLGSALIAQTATGAATLVFERRGPATFERTDGLREPVYLVALASNQPGVLLPESLFIETSAVEDANERIVGSSSPAPQAAPAAPAAATDEALKAELARARAALSVSERAFQLGQLEFARLTRDNAALGNELAAIRRSLSWRLTAFLRPRAKPAP